MKRKILFGITLIMLSMITINVNAQCRLITDSIIDGSNMTRHNNYIYNGGGQMVKVEYFDSNSVTVGAFDTLYYDGNDDMWKVERYWVGNSTPNYTGILTYNNHYVTSYAASGDNGDGPWTMDHDFVYNGSNELTDMILDDASVSGQPEGMAASFRNMVWTNGNPTYVEIVGDLGGGNDTLELNATYDTKNNLERLFPFTEASDGIGYYAANNIAEITFINDEDMGPAGTIALHNEFTYTGDEVRTMHEFPGVFEEDDKTTRYDFMDCLTGVETLPGEIDLKVFPNPVVKYMTVQTNEDITDIVIYNQVGEMVLNTIETTIDMSEFSTGVYFVLVNTEQGRTSRRIIVE